MLGVFCIQTGAMILHLIKVKNIYACYPVGKRFSFGSDFGVGIRLESGLDYE